MIIGVRSYAGEETDRDECLGPPRSFLVSLQSGQSLPNYSMVQVSLGSTSCLAAFWAASCVLKTSQSNFNPDQRMW